LSRGQINIPIEESTLSGKKQAGKAANPLKGECLAFYSRNCKKKDFHTAFHHTLPAYATTYAIPPALATRYQIRRYGFHGIAHASLADGYARAAG
jgi:hypothetical protein